MTRILKPNGRLSLCADLVREGSRLADIGTDHAYLPIDLVCRGRIPCAIACDINPLPLRAAMENIASYGLSSRIETRLCDGLSGVESDEVDDIVIAGMGGELIVQIIRDCPWIKDPEKLLILQPMTRHETLIRYLYSEGFEIVRHEAAEEGGKFYTVIAAHCDGVARKCGAYRAAVGLLTPDSPERRGFLNKTLDQMRKQSIGDPSMLPIVKRIEELLNETD